MDLQSKHLVMNLLSKQWWLVNVLYLDIFWVDYSDLIIDAYKRCALIHVVHPLRLRRNPKMHYPFERSNLPDPTFVVHLQYMTCIHNTITLYLQSYDTLSIYIYTQDMVYYPVIFFRMMWLITIAENWQAQKTRLAQKKCSEPRTSFDQNTGNWKFMCLIPNAFSGTDLFCFCQTHRSSCFFARILIACFQHSQ
jgi:hypothetical protein